MTYFQARHAADMFEDGVFRRVLSVNGKALLVAVRDKGGDGVGGDGDDGNGEGVDGVGVDGVDGDMSSVGMGSVDAPLLSVSVRGVGITDADADAALRIVRRMLGTDADIGGFYDMALADEHLAPLVMNMRGLRPTCAPTAYEALILAILGQQISTHVARMLRNLIIETYGERIGIDGETLYAFPQPQTIADAGVEGLRSIKFSRRKAEYISGISERTASGALSLEGMRALPDDEIVRGLMALRGVGAWTAHWMLIRGFGRADGFPHGDLALQRMMGTLAGDGSPMSADDALAYSARWSPWRSWVTAYMFGAGRTGRFAEIVGAE